MKKFASLALALVLAGCSSAELAQEEAVAHTVLVGIESGIDWSTANPAAVSAALDQLARVAPNNPSAQTVIAKARAAVAAGDLWTARVLISGGIALTAPASAPAPTTPGP